MSEPVDLKYLRLRYAGKCRHCRAELGQGASAFYDQTAKQVVCPACAGDPAKESDPVANVPASAPSEPGATGSPKIAETGLAAVQSGTAGASARREFGRRVAKREQRMRERHPNLGGMILALSSAPQSTTAWQRGTKGEELLGKRLDELTEYGVRLLHDRRIPGTRANIDHIAISSAGVFVVDAKRYKGRPSLRIEGGILRPRIETLMVGTRKSNPLVAGMTEQVARVTAVLAAGFADVTVTGMLAFIEADWPLLGGDFTTQGVKVLWPKKATEHILKLGSLAGERITELHRVLAIAFPPA
ncbi:MAG: NERD domain-containing protein [Actinomycetota bacterium]|nr:NERD domain-containing protein [Actinomycetota bacterium]